MNGATTAREGASHVQPRLGRHPRPRARDPLLRRGARRARLPPHDERVVRLRLGRRVAGVLGAAARRGRGDARATACTSPSSPPSREAVDAFHAAALAEGGSDAGAPGLRDYTPTTTPPSCATPTATSSRPCTCPTCRSRRSDRLRPACGRGDDDLDPPVLRPAARGVVAGDRLAVADAGGLHPPALDAVAGQDRRHRRRPPLAQGLVVGGRAGVVGVADHLHRRVGLSRRLRATKAISST